MNVKIISVLTLCLVSMFSIFSLVISYLGGVKGVGLIGVWFFMTFGMIVVLGQIIPAMILVFSFIKAIYGGRHQEQVIKSRSFA